MIEAVKEAMWLQGMLRELRIVQEGVTIFCDSQSAIYLYKHQVFHDRCKHIDVRLHFIRDEVEKCTVRVEKISTDHNPADMLTKTPPVTKFRYFKQLVKVESHSIPLKKE